MTLSRSFSIWQNRLGRWLETVGIRLYQPRRPKLKPGDRLDVLFQGDPDSYWVPHEFVEWLDFPTICPRCRKTEVEPNMAVRSVVVPNLLIVVRYADPKTIQWRIAS